MDKYHQLTPPEVPLEDISVPVAMVIGEYDKLATPADAEWTSNKISNALVFKETYPLGHLAFSLAKDMSWFTDDIVPLIGQYATNSQTKTKKDLEMQ